MGVISKLKGALSCSQSFTVREVGLGCRVRGNRGTCVLDGRDIWLICDFKGLQRFEVKK